MSRRDKFSGQGPTKRPQKHNKNVAAAPARQALRIIGGQWRGRKLEFASANGLRPTGDRIRETLFNWLTGHIHDAHCLDLFAGSGALSLEALSRGAASATLLETQVQAITTLKQHLQTLNCASSATVIGQSSLDWLQQPPLQQYDVVFIDPPFELDLWQNVFDRLSPWLTKDALIYVETPKGHPIQPPASWEPLKNKQTGQVSYQLFQFKSHD